MPAPHIADGSQPTVSIVMATYNRPDVLGFAIRSVLAQDFEDWELIVVGDHCSESTAEAVRAFEDPRIRYFNLAVNCGDQSGPNNEGISRARGRHIAFLNHDDLWFPDHLRASLDWLKASGADGVISQSAMITRPALSVEEMDDWRPALTGIGRRGCYDPIHTIPPASSVLLKAAAARAAGPWRAASDCFFTSSQEWVFRVWRRGFGLRTMPQLTAVQVPSGYRQGSYVRADIAEHVYFETLMKQPAELRALVLARHLPPSRPLWKRLARAVARPILYGAALLGFAPSELIARFYLGYRRGAFINMLRATRGLAPLPGHEPSPDVLRERYSTAPKPADKEPAP